MQWTLANQCSLETLHNVVRIYILRPSDYYIKESDVKTLLGKKCHNVCKNSSILCEAKAIYELCAVRDECSIFNMYELKELI